MQVRHALSLLGAAVLGVCTVGAAAQDYPNRPVRLVVANSPGAFADLVARLVGPELAKQLNQPVVVENRPGAANLIGYEYVAKRVPADGYTLVAAVASELATYPVTVKELNFDPVRDLPAIVGIAESRLVMGSGAAQPWQNFQELVTYAKANPGKLNAASSAALTRLLTAAVVQRLGLDVVDVPYNGGGPMFQSLLAGQSHFGFVGESTAIPNAEKFRVLAATGKSRRPPFMNVPTFAELGVPQIPGLFLSLNGPVGIPKPIIERIGSSTQKVLLQPEMKERFGKLSLTVVEDPPETAAARVPEEARLYAEIAKNAGMQPK